MERFFDKPAIRDEAFFGFDWQFALTDSSSFPTDDAAWRAVQLPHDWSVDYPVADMPAPASAGIAAVSPL